ncbi:10061_t:CDS:10 [Entrophospora sp. SA101]|nr:3039_t:CDS:10 [Entrophospora sp. SA101]CAJ0651101.1 10061_t:CDS:10 [Entrophospora sp. SA101]CAJ0836577.1 3806_t:CDS:10 [Entrophospora sp. SA101]
MDPLRSHLRQNPSPVQNSPQAQKMKVAKCTSEALALTNYLLVSPIDFHSSVRYVIIDGQFVFSIRLENSQPSRQIGTSMAHRRWASLSLNQEVSVAPFDPYSDGPNIFLGNLELEVGFLRKTQDSKEQFDTEEMSNIFSQLLVFDFHGTNLHVVAKGAQVIDQSSLQRDLTGGEPQPNQIQIQANRGILTQQTVIHWIKAPDSSLRLKGSSRSTTAIIQPNFKFEDMGIGGLDSEFSAIFRRAFASRIFPASLVEKLGIQHVKGILLYGPPGTGKTLMARQIGKMLNAREPKIVNGPEILNKYVGQSEENIRKLFAEAEKEYKDKGEDSGLHIIIFDELDAICKQRGAGGTGGTGVGDSVVNQLLAKMDGVEQLNNILIIGMTNRLDLIDEALLRPDNEILDSDVGLEELASLTKNFSGAEINGLVKSASSFAFNRHVKVGTLAGVTPDVENMKVNRNDFLAALDEVHPAFGVSEEDLQQCVQNQIIPFASHIERILSDGQLFIEQVRKSSRTPLVSVLLHGPPSSGKTALAATMAMASEFPFIKLISPESMVGYSESAKMTAINKVFNDSYKSPLSVIVVDNIERLLDWVPIGPRFSNSVLQTLLVLLKKRPPKDRRLLILATTNEKSVLQQMDMSDCFNSEIEVPNINDLDSIEIVLKELALFNNDEREQALEILRQNHLIKINIGIKKLLMIIEMSRQDVDKVDKFVSTIMGF